LLLLFEAGAQRTVDDVDDNIGDEFDKPFDDKLSAVVVVLNVINCTVSLHRESMVNNGNRPSATASNIHGSSPLIKALDNPLRLFLKKKKKI
jgi:hypothetical protein